MCKFRGGKFAQRGKVAERHPNPKLQTHPTTYSKKENNIISRHTIIKHKSCMTNALMGGITPYEPPHPSLFIYEPLPPYDFNGPRLESVVRGEPRGSQPTPFIKSQT